MFLSRFSFGVTCLWKRHLHNFMCSDIIVHCCVKLCTKWEGSTGFCRSSIWIRYEWNQSEWYQWLEHISEYSVSSQTPFSPSLSYSLFHSDEERQSLVIFNIKRNTVTKILQYIEKRERLKLRFKVASNIAPLNMFNSGSTWHPIASKNVNYSSRTSIQFAMSIWQISFSPFKVPLQRQVGGLVDWSNLGPGLYDVCLKVADYTPSCSLVHTNIPFHLTVSTFPSGIEIMMCLSDYDLSNDKL